MTNNKLIQTFLFIVKESEVELGQGLYTYMLCFALIAIHGIYVYKKQTSTKSGFKCIKDDGSQPKPIIFY